MLMPGFPDIYRGDENGLLALTDPDNRLPVDWDALAAQGDDPDAKLHWTRQLLALRRDQADFLEGADAQVQVEDDGAALRLIRSQHDRTMTVEFAPGGACAGCLLGPCLFRRQHGQRPDPEQPLIGLTNDIHWNNHALFQFEGESPIGLLDFQPKDSAGVSFAVPSCLENPFGPECCHHPAGGRQGHPPA
ncbi:hypothetical protein ACFSYD_08275 [Paracoccus aerius]